MGWQIAAVGLIAVLALFAAYKYGRWDGAHSTLRIYEAHIESSAAEHFNAGYNRCLVDYDIDVELPTAEAQARMLENIKAAYPSTTNASEAVTR